MRKSRRTSKPHTRKGPPTRAAQALARWLEARPPGHTARVAEVLGVSQPAVYQWAQGITIPSEVMRLALERLTAGRVRFVEWRTDEQAARLAEILERARDDEWQTCTLSE